jgi:hypothetical protein
MKGKSTMLKLKAFEAECWSGKGHDELEGEARMLKLKT